MKPASTTSLPLSERIPTLDVLRGFALLGILVMNMPGFSASPFAEADGSHLWPGAVDQFAEELRNMLFAGKFNSMFSLLFGLGFTIQFARMRERDPARASRLYLRRLSVLWLVGVLHALLLWTGDVLHVYALLGIVMLFGLGRVSDRGIVVLIVLCLVYPVVSGLLRLQLVTPEVTAARVALSQGFELSNNIAYGSGGYFDAVRENARVMAFEYDNRWSLWGNLGWYIQLMLTMLIGLLAGRRRWAQRIPELLPRIARGMWWALAIGLATGAAFTIIFALNRTPGPSPIKMLGGLCFWVSRLALMLFYVLLIVRLMQTAAGPRWFAPLAVAGRMPLTNYLMQSAICTTLFYGWGFGLWGRMGPAWGLVLALAIYFAIQVPLSLWWLARHERGPMEALWARLTYGPAAARAAPGGVIARP